MDWFRKLLGGSNDKEIKKLNRIVEQVDAFEPQIKAKTDSELRDMTRSFKARLGAGEGLDDLLPEAFAVVREAAVRTVGMRHFGVQLIGGIVLHQGRIAEMRTGEGKTLVATLPAYLNALEGKGVHIVTVNDYLARYHSEWMGKIFRFLGMSVGLITHDMEPAQRQQAYAADITYGTNNEFGFDYLRDNMVIRKENMVQRELHFAIVDEVDSILIDEARTPLIISGQGDKSTEMYTLVDRFVARLKNEQDYTVDEKLRTVNLTDEGVSKAEQQFNVENLSDIANTELNHHINQALKAHAIMKRDKDYVVQNGEVIIVDEFTGRLMTGRRYSEGLHQAIEAKEHVTVARESKTLATITFQNYFRMYQKLSGMTGTAKTEEEEFQGIYGLDVVTIPTNKPMIREDLNDVIYTTKKGKYNAVIAAIQEKHATGQPVLVGTVSVEVSELLSEMLKRKGVPHTVLNAKYHAKEAEIVAQAGQVGAVTIATNMAGRGTDILLGGNPEFLTRQEMRQMELDDHLIEEAMGHNDTDDEEVLRARKIYNDLMAKHKKVTDEEHKKVVACGGLHIIGTERHESRRIDNQLRGRAGRQGDPGSSRFYIALEDDIMRLFGSEKIMPMVDKLGVEEDQPIEYGLLSKQIESAQKRVEANNFDTRKHVLQYDDVMNQQREVIYGQRRKVLMGENIKDSMLEMLDQLISDVVDVYCTDAEWELEPMRAHFERVFLPRGANLELPEDAQDRMAKEELVEKIQKLSRHYYELKEADITEHGVDMRELERVVLLRVVDQKWMDHIDAMDQLRQGIGLRAIGQRDPVVEYKFEGYDMFEQMIASIREDAISMLFRVNVERVPQREQVAKPTVASHGDDEPAAKQPAKTDKKVGRNDPCPCGSGKKYKHCHGRNL
ncbi:preprotein translocase subunit SecA [Christensenellaceae bacterium NSJ-44]|uniref:Protein translocase subunit SecA n=2 Tax=Luoshenia tenuis TaxID=2763654 RepID=A0A926CY54_9FIRM|nr:preprotein translocase subunit SecA [Luoshenia tenuis]MBC8527832.1 preprotein translocase subunit SecA [Luoshenia tenuis]